MTDGVTLNLGVGGAVVDTEVPAARGKHIQRVKIVLGDIDADGGDVASDNAMPVSMASVPLPTGAALEGGGNLAATATALGTPADAAWGGSGVSTIVAALKAIYNKLIGSVAVTGAFFQATQPVSAASLPLPAGAAQETGGNLATLAGAITASVVQANTKQVNGVTTLAGAGATGTGSQRVTTAQDTTTVAGSAPGTAGTPSAQVVSVQGVAGGTAQPVSGTVTANAGTNLNTSLLALETGGNLAAIKANTAAQDVGSGAFAAAQGTVGVAAASLVAARTGAIGTGRISVTIKNNGTVPIYLGASAGVTTLTGFPMQPGDGFSTNTTAAIFAISGTAGQNVGIWETF